MSTDDDTPDADPRAGVLEVEVARERTREAMFGRAGARQRVGRFLLLAPLGRGGMGIVFSALDPELDRRVAIKLVRPRHGDPDRAESLRARFVAEARAMAKVSHPNVLTIYEAGCVADDPSLVYLAMELVDGTTLRRWVAERERGWREVVDAHLQAARGLAAVHRSGLVHRDFKGENAMVDPDGRVRVMDFGLARDVVDSITDTRPDAASPGATTQLSGTPGYMSPEQLRGGPVDHRADQYALCVSLYESLWGWLPPSHGARELALPPRTPAPAWVGAVIRRGLSHDREQRFVDMDELIDALTPRERVRTMATVGALALVSITGLALAGRPAACPDVGDDVGRIAAPATLAAIEPAFVATGLPYATSEAQRSAAALRSYAEAWAHARREACEAARSGIQSDARRDRRAHCLERRLREATSIAALLRDADAAIVDAAVGIVEGLTRPERCDEDAFLESVGGPPDDPRLASDVADLDARLARVEALLDADPSTANTLAEQALVDADATGFAPVVARAELLRARARARAGAVVEAFDQLRAAFFAARRTGQPSEAATAALELGSTLSTGAGEIASARLWHELAGYEIEVHGLTDLEPLAVGVAASIAHSEGEWEKALELSEQQLSLVSASCSAGTGGCDRLGEVYLDLAQTLVDLARPDEAAEHARRALEQELSLHEPGHPSVARARVRLGETLSMIGRVEEAFTQLSEGVTALEHRFQRGHDVVIDARARLAQTFTTHGRAEAAIGLLRDSLDDAKKAKLAAAIPSLHHSLGFAYYYANRLDEAAHEFREAITSSERLFPGGHVNTAMAIGNLANLEFERGDFGAALAGFTRALELRRAHVRGDDPGQLPMLVNIAASLARLGRERDSIVWLEQAVEVTREGTLEDASANVRIALATLVLADDPERAFALVAEVERRCAALSPEQRETAGCARAAKWRAQQQLDGD